MGLFSDLANIGVRAGYDKYVVALEPVLVAMGARGVPVSPARYAEVIAEVREKYAEAERAMQALVPDEVRPFVPKGGYKKLPKDLGGPRAGNPFSPSTQAAAAEVAQTDQPLSGADQAPSRSGAWERGVVEPSPEFLLRRFPDGEDRWTRLLPWKPSHAGLLRYMKHRNHPVPRDWKSGKETTLELELVRLAKETRDPLYAAVLEYRHIGTVLNNHLANWEPGADGRVHPTFYYETGTGQLASRRPNVQNAPKHGEGTKLELANAFRSMVVARPGHTLLESDHRSFHAQTLAFEAQDSDYLRLAKLDVHSFLTAHFVRWPGAESLLQRSDVDLACELSRVRKAHPRIRDMQAKRAVLGYGFGMGWRKLYMLNRDSFGSMSEAKRLMDTLNALFPRARAWRDEIRMKAHEQGYLLSRFGCIRWFWEVFKWKGGKWEPGGDDSEAAVAFLPANDAFCHIKSAMLRMQSHNSLEALGLINQMHDALLFECPDELVEHAINLVKWEMERPSDTLIDPVVAPGGLSVEVSVRVGKSWNSMEEVSR